MAERQPVRRPPRATTVVAATLAGPLVIAALLVVQPALDGRWQHETAHFWLVGATALAGTVVALRTSEAASRRGDARLVLLALAFGTSAVFLGAHAVATPKVIATASNEGFEVAVPLGLALAGALALLATVDLGAARATMVLRLRWPAWAAVFALGALCIAAAVVGSGPLADPPSRPGSGSGIDVVVSALGAAGTVLFAVAAVRFLFIARARGRARLVIAMVAALVLLADALAVAQIGRNWRATWWEWHLLLGVAFVVVAAVMRTEARREGGRAGLLDSLALERTLVRVRADYASALDDLVRAMERAAEADDDRVGDDITPLVTAVARRFDLTDQQARLLEQAARALGENRRLYRELDGLFRSYLSPDVAAALVAQPDLSALGGSTRTVTVLHADLAGFTPFSERAEPTAVVAMLNQYFGAVVPAVLGEGGTVTQFVGDALMAVFGAPADQPDHAARACRAGLALQAAAEEVTARREWPRFRVGIHTGPALVGNIGSDSMRTFTAIGDTTNLAARLEANAPVGGVLVSAATATAAAPLATWTARAVGPLAVKGRAEPVEAFVLDVIDVPDGADRGAGSQGGGPVS